MIQLLLAAAFAGFCTAVCILGVLYDREAKKHNDKENQS